MTMSEKMTSRRIKRVDFLLQTKRHLTLMCLILYLLYQPPHYGCWRWYHLLKNIYDYKLRIKRQLKTLFLSSYYIDEIIINTKTHFYMEERLFELFYIENHFAAKLHYLFKYFVWHIIYYDIVQ